MGASVCMHRCVCVQQLKSHHPPLPPPQRDLAKEIQCKLEYTTMRNVISRTEVW